MVIRPNPVAHWYARADSLYGISLNGGARGSGLYAVANRNFFAKNETDFFKIKEQYGATHIITDAKHTLKFRIVAANKEFILYEIR